MRQKRAAGTGGAEKTIRDIRRATLNNPLGELHVFGHLYLFGIKSEAICSEV